MTANTCLTVHIIELVKVLSISFHRSLENNEPKEYYAEIQRILNQMGVPHNEAHKKKKGRSTSPSSQTDPDR